MRDLEALRLAEAFFARKPEALLLAVEAYPGRFTNRLLLPAGPSDFPADLWARAAGARRFRCGKN